MNIYSTFVCRLACVSFVLDYRRRNWKCRRNTTLACVREVLNACLSFLRVGYNPRMDARGERTCAYFFNFTVVVRYVRQCSNFKIKN